MKLSILDKALIGLFVVVCVLATAAVGLTAVGIDPLNDLAQGLRENAPGILWRLIVSGICVVWILLGVFVLRCVFPPRQKKGDFIVMSGDESGSIRISVSAVREIASNAVRDIEGLDPQQIDVGTDRDSVTVHAVIDVTGHLNVPEATAELKRMIRSRIVNACGVTVGDIMLDIRSVAAEQDHAFPVTFAQAEPVITAAVPDEFPGLQIEEAEADGETDSTEQSEQDV